MESGGQGWVGELNFKQCAYLSVNVNIMYKHYAEICEPVYVHVCVWVCLSECCVVLCKFINVTCVCGCMSGEEAQVGKSGREC